MPSTIKDDESLTMLYLLIVSQKFPVVAVILSRTKLRDFLSLAQLHIRDYHICRSALVNPDASSFQMLCKSGNNQSLIFYWGWIIIHSITYQGNLPNCLTHQLEKLQWQEESEVKQ